MGIEMIATIISVILGVVASIFGIKYKKYKQKVTNGINLLNEVKKSYEDNKISSDEIKRIINKYEGLVNDN